MYDDKQVLLQYRRTYTKRQLFTLFLAKQAKVFIFYGIEVIVVLALAIYFTFLNIGPIFPIVFYLCAFFSLGYVLYLVIKTKNRMDINVIDDCLYELNFYKDEIKGAYKYARGEEKIRVRFQDINRIKERKNKVKIKTHNTLLELTRKDLGSDYEKALKIIKDYNRC